MTYRQWYINAIMEICVQHHKQKLSHKHGRVFLSKYSREQKFVYVFAAD